MLGGRTAQQRHVPGDSSLILPHIPMKVQLCMGWCGDVVGEKFIVVVKDLSEFVVLIVAPEADVGFVGFPIPKEDGCFSIDLILV